MNYFFVIQAASISKDGHALVWDLKKGKKHAEMGWDPPNKIKYLYKRIRFGRIEGESKRFKVFTIVNPVGASKVTTSDDQRNVNS